MCTFFYLNSIKKRKCLIIVNGLNSVKYNSIVLLKYRIGNEYIFIFMRKHHPFLWNLKENGAIELCIVLSPLIS